ncbi:hypothetical protein [Phytohabitans houttuyneae]|uniref:Uncharacterized protein n=1 Tax=Phytohabitans houttuyneae TaxID=1076126 RepID=A0A6V8JXH8_9ACTN|nr:hypothetical protein [Phytohabitans houttuyneae]GFJ77463.1 hypothetical protein Phou_016430 [Phytohabitans houttuyneae]
MTDTPDIPVHLVGRARSGGLVVPRITPVTRTGVALFGNVVEQMQRECLHGRTCQVCGRPFGQRAVLFARGSDLPYQCTAEPATCPPCAAYSVRACPMLAGRRDRHRAGQHPALAGFPASADQLLRMGAPAEAWYAVWVTGYDVVTHPAQPDTAAALWRRIPPLRIRPLPAAA